MSVELSLGDFLQLKRQLLDPGIADVDCEQVDEFEARQRADVARRAGISLAYYDRLEDGRSVRPSRRVRRALVGALQLSPEEAAVLEQIAGTAGDASRVAISTGIEQLFRSWADVPAVLFNSRMDVLASTDAAQALSAMFKPGTNVVRSIFLDPDVYGAIRNWHRVEEATLAWLRAQASEASSDRSLVRLVGEISLKSPEFRTAWAHPPAAPQGGGQLLLMHELVGALDLSWRRLEIPDRRDQFIVVLYAASGSSSAHALRNLNGAATDVAEIHRAGRAPHHETPRTDLDSKDEK